MKRKVHLRLSEDHDWIEIYLDGIPIHSGHSFSHRNLRELLERLAVEVSEETVPHEARW